MNDKPTTPDADADTAALAQRIHADAIVIDGHNDLAMRLREVAGGVVEGLDRTRPALGLHTDLPRLRAGGVGGQFFAAFVPPLVARDGEAVACALEQIHLIHRLIDTYPDDLALARSADDVRRIHAGGRIACLVAVENGQAIAGSLENLHAFRELGAQYLTLTHIDTHDWCDAGTDAPRHGGLSAFGEEVVAEMNRIGMMVDISHVSADAARAALRVSRAPVIASHSGAFAIVDHPRNVPDDVLQMIRDNRGMVMVNFYPGFLHDAGAQAAAKMLAEYRRLVAAGAGEADIWKQLDAWQREHPMPRGTAASVVDHVDHIVRVAGVDCVGIGSDFDGISVTLEGLCDVSGYPLLTEALVRRGYNEPDIRKILGENILRVMDEVQASAAAKNE